jgi:hypothetical protein
LLNSSHSQIELRHAPKDICGSSSQQPTPAQHRANVFVDRREGSLSRRRGHIGHHAQHDDAQNHGQRLYPQEGKTSQHAQVQTTGQRPATQSDGTLQPARPAEFGVRAQHGDSALGLSIFQGLTVGFYSGIFCFVGHGEGIFWGGGMIRKGPVFFC